MIRHKRMIIDQPRRQQKVTLHYGLDPAGGDDATVCAVQMRVRGRLRVLLSPMTMDEMELALIWFRFDVLAEEIREELDRMRTEVLAEIRHKFASLRWENWFRDYEADRQRMGREAWVRQYIGEWQT